MFKPRPINGYYCEANLTRRESPLNKNHTCKKKKIRPCKVENLFIVNIAIKITR